MRSTAGEESGLGCENKALGTITRHSRCDDAVMGAERPGFGSLTGCGAVLKCRHQTIWGFPKIGGTILGVPMIRTIVFWGLYWGKL